MRAPGIVGTLQLAAVLAIAAPLLLFGLDWLAAGRVVLGGAFVGLAVAMLALQHWLRNPLDPADVVEAALDRVGRDDEE